MIKRICKDNRGSSLIMALIVISFITILGTTMMSMVIATYKLKSMDRISKEAYYTVDTAVDEIYAGLANEAYLQLKEAYQYVVQNLVDTSGVGVGTITNEAANMLLKNKYFEYVEDQFNDMTAEDELKVYVSNGAVSVATENPMSVIMQGGERYIIFDDVTLSYADASNGYFSEVTLDFVIGYPEDADIEIIDDGIDALMTFRDYAFVTDDKVEVTAGSTVNGGVCGNSGVDINCPQEVRIDGGNVVSREDVNINYSASLIHNNGKIWAKDILITKGKLTIDSGSAAYIRDDLTFSSSNENNSATIKGSYYGYSGEGAAADNAHSSAIIINGKNSVLNLTEVKNLVLSGYGWIGFEYTDPYRMGGSIAIKGDQLAYILPEAWGGAVPANFYAYDLLAAGEKVVHNGETIESGNRKYYFKFATAADTASFFKSLFDDEEFDKICDEYGIPEGSRVTANEDRDYFKAQVIVNYNTYLANQIEISSSSRVYAPGIMFATDYINSGNNGNYREFDAYNIAMLEDDCIDRYDIINSLLLEMPDDWHHSNEADKGYLNKRVSYANMRYSHVITATEIGNSVLDNILKGKNKIADEGNLYYLVDENNDGVWDTDYFIYVTNDDVSVLDVKNATGLGKGIIISAKSVTANSNFEGSILAFEGINVAGGTYTAAPELMEEIFRELPGAVGYFTGEAVYGGRTTTTAEPANPGPGEAEAGDLDSISAASCIQIKDYRKGGTE